MKELLNRYLLELILMDTVASSHGRCIPGAERVIQRSLPPGLYDCIIQRYDELSDDQDDSNPRFLDPWLRMAANQNPRWKRKMILRFLCIMRAGGPIGRAELGDVAVLAAAMSASREYGQALCSAIHINRRFVRATRSGSCSPTRSQSSPGYTVDLAGLAEPRGTIDAELFAV